MVAGGSRITPLYQIIQSVCNAKDPIRLTLLFLNRTEDDILLEEELAAFCKANENLKVYYSVDQVTKPNWTGFSGFINKEKIQQTLG
jgi:NAD(P)H-flavin reductase